MRTRQILVADDDESIRWVLEHHFRADDNGYRVTTAVDGRESLELLAERPFDLVFLDIKMPHASGLEILDQVKEDPRFAHNRLAMIVVMTAQNTMQNAVEAMKGGAYDYVTKPFDLDAIRLLAEKALAHKDQIEEIQRLKAQLEEKNQQAPLGEIIGTSQPMQEIFKSIGKVAGREVSVLINGESGTGKELIARAIHTHARPDKPFIAINTAAIPHELLESELFGFEKGTFTGATESRAGKFSLAHTGTLFLDEIGDMPLDLQAKLLRVLEERRFYPLGGKKPVEVDVRIIAATHADLKRKVEQGAFREDLYFRLNVFPIHVPPLRERPEDIPLLAEHFLEKYCDEFGEERKMLHAETMQAIKEYAWPGNVREMENAVKRAILLTGSSLIMPEDFPGLKRNSGTEPGEESDAGFEEIVRANLTRYFTHLDEASIDNLYEIVIAHVERPLIQLVLQKTRGNQIRASKILGINRNTLRKKIGELDIVIPKRGRE